MLTALLIAASTAMQAQERRRSLGSYTMYEQIIYQAKQERIMEWLADDMSEGRATGTDAGMSTARFIEVLYRQYGLEPLFGSSFYQPFIADSLSGSRGRNVVGIVRSEVPSDEYVLISAHYDHLGILNGNVYNGADDNASGVTVLLNLADMLGTMKKTGTGPDKNIIFAALDAKDIAYKGKMYSRYELSQKQRALERKVRAAKRQYLAEDAAGLDTTQSAVKLKTARQNLAQFVKDTGSRNDSARAFVQGFGRSEASRATAQARGYAKTQERAILVENLRKAGNFRKAAQIHLTPTSIDADALGFDDAHINAQRSHRVTEAQAKQWIRDAKISVTVWGGQFERYYGEAGAAYVNVEGNYIRTAYSVDEFDKNVRALMEEIKKNGL